MCRFICTYVDIHIYLEHLFIYHVLIHESQMQECICTHYLYITHANSMMNSHAAVSILVPIFIVFLRKTRRSPATLKVLLRVTWTQ